MDDHAPQPKNPLINADTMRTSANTITKFFERRTRRSLKNQTPRTNEGKIATALGHYAFEIDQPIVARWARRTSTEVVDESSLGTDANRRDRESHR
jgi:hypothetical protein